MTVTIEESNDGGDGVSGSWAYTYCGQLGLDAGEITERVAAAQKGTLEGATR